MEKDIKEKIIKVFEENKGFASINNIRVVDIEDDYTKLEVDVTSDSLNPNGIVHGGLLFGLADNAMGIAAVSTGRNVCTLNAQIDYLRPGKGKKLIAISEKVKVGKTIAVYKCNIYDENNRHLATCTGTYYFMD